MLGMSFRQKPLSSPLRWALYRQIVAAAAITFKRRDDTSYVTSDYWFKIERCEEGWTISRYCPGDKNEARLRYFLYRLAKEWPHEVPVGETRIHRLVYVGSLAEAKRALAGVGYKTLPEWRCRDCGSAVASSRGSWRHCRGNGSTPAHQPQAMDSWEYEETFCWPELAQSVTDVAELELDHPALLPSNPPD